MLWEPNHLSGSFALSTPRHNGRRVNIGEKGPHCCMKLREFTSGEFSAFGVVVKPLRQDYLTIGAR